MAEGRAFALGAFVAWCVGWTGGDLSIGSDGGLPKPSKDLVQHRRSADGCHTNRALIYRIKADARLNWLSTPVTRIRYTSISLLTPK